MLLPVISQYLAIVVYLLFSIFKRICKLRENNSIKQRLPKIFILGLKKLNSGIFLPLK